MRPAVSSCPTFVLGRYDFLLFKQLGEISQETRMEVQVS